LGLRIRADSAMPTQRGTRAAKQIPVRINTRPCGNLYNGSIQSHGGVNSVVNRVPVLTPVQRAIVNIPAKKHNISVCALNPRSVGNKTLALSDYIISNDFDIVALTETWLNKHSQSSIGELVPAGYKIRHVPRCDNRCGGGVAILHKEGISASLVSSTKDSNFTHFEHLNCLFSYKDVRMQLAVVYRPPPSQRNGLKNSVFFSEWPLFLEKFVPIKHELYIVGDMNFHLDSPNDSDTVKFTDSLQACDFMQHVTGPTHLKGHTLDVVITRNTTHNTHVRVVDPVLCDKNGNVSGDHFAIHFKAVLVKPCAIQKSVSYRKLRDVDITDIRQSIMDSLPIDITDSALNDMVSTYNTCLRDVIDQHAPIIERTIHLRPSSPWYSDELRCIKRERRKLERKWQLTGLEIHHQIYRNKCVEYNKLLNVTKSSYYSSTASLST